MKDIGLIGLGLMGKPMAKNLLKAGFKVAVHSRSPEPVAELAALGATAAPSVRAVAEASEAVITMVPDAPEVEQVVTGPEGILAGAHPGLIHIDMSTISPVATRRLAELEQRAGVTLLDAPVSGGVTGAVNGTLSGVLTGAAFARHLNTLENLNAVQNLGHVFMAYRTDLFLPAGEFSRRMDEILRMLKAAEPAPGVPRVMAAGEVEFATEARNRERGVPLQPEVVQQLAALGAQADVDFN